MGLTKTKTNDARDAYAEGRTIFTATLATGFTGTGDNWGEAIQAIEAEGWVLDQWSVNLDRKGTLNAYPVFRRR